MKYETTDIVMAAFLKVAGYTMTELVMTDKRGTFVFTDVTKEHIDAYFLGNALVEPVSFNGAIRQLTTACRRV